MSYRSSPSFAIGGVSWLASEGRESSIFDPVVGGWRCFHCNEHFRNSRAALRHFGYPLDKQKPRCMRHPRDPMVHMAASLAAAISLLEGGGKKAAPSDKMFEQMLIDYRNALEAGRKALGS